MKFFTTPKFILYFGCTIIFFVDCSLFFVEKNLTCNNRAQHKNNQKHFKWIFHHITILKSNQIPITSLSWNNKSYDKFLYQVLQSGTLHKNHFLWKKKSDIKTKNVHYWKLFLKIVFDCFPERSSSARYTILQYTRFYNNILLSYIIRINKI